MVVAFKRPVYETVAWEGSFVDIFSSIRKLLMGYDSAQLASGLASSAWEEFRVF